MDKLKLDEIITCRDESLKNIESIQKNTGKEDLPTVLKSVISKNIECFNKIKKFNTGDYPHIGTALDKTSTRINLETGLLNSLLTTLEGKQTLNKAELSEELVSRLMLIDVARTHEIKFWTVANEAIIQHEGRQTQGVSDSSFGVLFWVGAFIGFMILSKYVYSFFNKDNKKEK